MSDLDSALEIVSATHPGMVRSHNEDSIAIEKESGLTGLILRPLSAQNFSPTLPEQEGVVVIKLFNGCILLTAND